MARAWMSVPESTTALTNCLSPFPFTHARTNCPQDELPVPRTPTHNSQLTTITDAMACMSMGPRAMESSATSAVIHETTKSHSWLGLTEDELPVPSTHTPRSPFTQQPRPSLQRTAQPLPHGTRRHRPSDRQSHRSDQPWRTYCEEMKHILP